MTNLHNIQNVILLWAISFKAVSIVSWFVWLGSASESYHSFERAQQMALRRRSSIKLGSITGIIGLILLSVYILMNMG